MRKLFGNKKAFGYKGHIIIGFTTMVLLGTILGKFSITNIKFSKDLVILFFIILIYSQLPDIDADISKINNYFNTFIGLLGVYAVLKLNDKFLAVSCFAIVIYLEWVKHRGKIHTILTGMLLSIPIYIYFHSFYFAVIAFLAFMSHLLADWAKDKYEGKNNFSLRFF